jgi:hypothetical protein
LAYVTMIAMLALIEYTYFGFAVSGARGRSGVQAPAVSGDDAFERYFRAHQNTLEQLIVFLPALYASASFVGPLYAVAFGVLFLVGRAVYFRAYVRDASKRGPGMIVTMIANVALILGGLVGAILSLV